LYIQKEKGGFCACVVGTGPWSLKKKKETRYLLDAATEHVNKNKEENDTSCLSRKKLQI